MRVQKVIPRSLALLVAAALAAVTCDDGRPEVPLAEQFAKAFCAHQLSCCSPYELSVVTSDRYKTEAECLPFATLAARQQLGAIEGAIAQGRISVDPVKLDACVAAYQERACNRSPQLPTAVSPLPDLGIALTTCPDLFVGHVPVNAACNLTQECAAGSRCAGGPTQPMYGTYPGVPVPLQLTPNPGLCIRSQKDGEPCNESSDCAPNHSCRTPEFVCGPPTAEGQPCVQMLNPLTGLVTSNCDVNAGLFCDDVTSITPICRHFPRAGQPCDQFRSPQCDPDPALGLSCDFFSGICRAPGNEGDACGGPAIPPCRGDLACHATQPDGIGTCGALPALGDRCTDRCASPALCAAGVCTNPGTTPAGQPCNNHADCASLSCSGLSGQFVCSANAIEPRCVGADVTSGNVMGFGGFGGTSGVGGFGGRPPPTGIAGSGGFITGAGGAGGKSMPPLGCPFSTSAPESPIIATFDNDVIPIGGTFIYAAPDNGIGPTATIENGALHVTVATAGRTEPQYSGAGIYFNGDATGTACIAAPEFKGIQFDISGAVSGIGCTMQFSINDSAHMDSAIDPKGSGPAGSYPPQLAVTVPATTMTIQVPYFGPAAPTGGSPAISVDPLRLVGVQWQFTTAAGTENSCTVDITIDNVRFF